MRVIVFLLVAALLALTGYAYFGDMSADPRPTRVPVRLDLGTVPPAPPAPAAATAPAEAPLDPAAEVDAPDDPDALD
ncbi:MAG TPA: hypothetical protein GXX24_14480 [Paracoccus solventivorans]|uniref:Uncharacterized protein n=1 Tax=Paracoccus solventivorans TaxID=53463 RepID=A0A832QYQ4_9RHOB|nr:hypothetical protein [Paracoccus solventivorans]